MDTEKNRLRKEIRQEKNQYNPAQLRKMSASVWEQLEQNPHFRQAKVVVAYWSLPDEVYTHDFVRKWASDKTILLPVIDGENLLLKSFEGDVNLHIEEKFHIPEPTEGQIYPIEEVDLIIVPGMAFDKQNNRMGRGKAFYDKLLKNAGVYKIGVCFGFQYLESIPATKLDVPMDEVIVSDGAF